MNAAIGAELYKEILHFPEKDDVRMIYADWLEENGDEGFARVIRYEIHNPGHSSATEKTYAGLYAACPLSKRVRFGVVSELISLGCQQVKFRRGFVEWVSAPLAVLVDKGPFLVGRHPITEMTVTDRQPWRTRTSRNLNEYGWWNWLGYEDPNADNNHEDLPADVWDLIEKPKAYADTAWKWFSSPEEAHLALAKALVLHARTRAGLC